MTQPSPQTNRLHSWLFPLILALGLPLLSLQLSDTILSRLPIIKSFIQVNGQVTASLWPALIIGALLLFIGLKRRNKLTHEPSWLVAGSAGAIVVSLALIWFQFLAVQPSFPMSQRPFDAETWKRAGCGTSRVRQTMIVDLRTKVQGLSTSEIENLLGQPESGDQSYCLGPEPTILAVDRLLMLVLYDRSNQAIDVRVSAN